MDVKEFVSHRKSIQAAKIDDLKAFRATKFAGNPFQLFFEYLAELIPTNTSEDSIHRAHERKISVSSNTTELSTSSNEGKHENVNAEALRVFIKTILSNVEYFNYLGSQRNDKAFLKCFASETRLRWTMGGVTHVAVDDRSIGVNFRGSHSGSDRSSQVPVVCLESKPRDAGGVKRRSGESEPFILTIFAQELSELIGAMVAQTTKVPTAAHDDQELFTIGMHGTIFYISAAYFSTEYIQYVKDSRPAQEDFDEFLWVRRSVHFDFKDENQRVQALRFLWALIRYIVSGEAKINIVTAAVNA